VIVTDGSTKILAGQKALVTGANSGIGEAVAIALGQAGAEIVVNYVTGEDRAEAVAEEIRRSDVRAFTRRTSPKNSRCRKCSGAQSPAEAVAEEIRRSDVRAFAHKADVSEAVRRDGALRHGTCRAHRRS
jgi:NAD(P)-dependent dehydrogenase (short-subunit alcohol dehydrogenase family)